MTWGTLTKEKLRNLPDFGYPYKTEYLIKRIKELRVHYKGKLVWKRD